MQRVLHSNVFVAVLASLLTATMLMGGMAVAQNGDGDTSYTGCLTRYGRLYKVAEGDEPFRPCSRLTNKLRHKWRR